MAPPTPGKVGVYCLVCGGGGSLFRPHPPLVKKFRIFLCGGGRSLLWLWPSPCGHFIPPPPPTDISIHQSPFGHFIVSPPPTGSLLTHLPHPRDVLLPHPSLPPWSLYLVKNIRCGKSQSISATTVLHALVNISSLESLCFCLFLRTAVHLVSTFERKFPLPEPHDLQVDITQRRRFLHSQVFV